MHHLYRRSASTRLGSRAVSQCWQAAHQHWHDVTSWYIQKHQRLCIGMHAEAQWTEGERLGQCPVAFPPCQMLGEHRTERGPLQCEADKQSNLAGKTQSRSKNPSRLKTNLTTQRATSWSRLKPHWQHKGLQAGHRSCQAARFLLANGQLCERGCTHLG